MFAARVVSVFSAFRPLVIRFSAADTLDPSIKFHPRFFLLTSQEGELRHIPVELVRAWMPFFGTFLFFQAGTQGFSKPLFVPVSNPKSGMLRICLNRLRAEESPETPALSAYFWRLHVLR